MPFWDFKFVWLPQKYRLTMSRRKKEKKHSILKLEWRGRFLLINLTRQQPRQVAGAAITGSTAVLLSSFVLALFLSLRFGLSCSPCTRVAAEKPAVHVCNNRGNQFSCLCASRATFSFCSLPQRAVAASCSDLSHQGIRTCRQDVRGFRTRTPVP